MLRQGYAGNPLRRISRSPAPSEVTDRWPCHPKLNERRMAEREGFEPSVPLRVHVISNHAHSTTLPPLRVCDGSAGGQAVEANGQGRVCHAGGQRKIRGPRAHRVFPGRRTSAASGGTVPASSWQLPEVFGKTDLRGAGREPTLRRIFPSTSPTPWSRPTPITATTARSRARWSSPGPIR